MNATAEYQSILRHASDVEALRVRQRDAVEAAGNAAHDLHAVQGQLRTWSTVQAMTPFTAVGAAIAAVIIGLLLTSVLPGGTLHVGALTLLAIGGPITVGAVVFQVASARVARLRHETMNARSAVNLSDIAVRDAEKRLEDATDGYWARKRPTN
ncbi:hypothetical protein [Curtobacterium sp. MCSS17_016]|uniref:hypothetical protein n=1 Tax=Curtobacterium sp. MCSS17_016 TaxID=2175644 RepID=UPI0011B62D9C|nr:hypothetical protein [Curtobacterium sp. MCSS17_016]WIE81354.1 hypothetical protein DEJ19_019155 [Curtobacterium sp. MCSS17_016]